MNERNVEALAELIRATAWDDFTEAESRDFAKRLASRGVLVPSVLTGVEAWQVVADIDSMTHTTDEARSALLIRLERIAKGEAT